MTYDGLKWLTTRRQPAEYLDKLLLRGFGGDSSVGMIDIFLINRFRWL